MSRLLGLTPGELGVLIAAFALTLPAVTPRIYASDEIQYFSYLRSLWFDGDVSFENEYRYFYDRHIGRGENFHETFLERQTEAGRRPNFGTIGAALLWAPFYGAGHLVARISGAEADGYSRPYVAAVAYGSALYGFAAVVLAAALARRVISPALGLRGSPWIGANPSQVGVRGSARIGGQLTGATGEGGRPDETRPGSDERRIGAETIAAILVWIGTPLLFYMYIAPPFAHACSAFAVALFLFVWLRVRRSWTAGGAVALGLCGALMAMVREQDVLFAAGPVLDLVITAARSRTWRREISGYLKIAVAGCAAFVVGYVPQLLAYVALNGYPGPSGLVVRKMSWHSPHALQVLGSPEHGFLFWTPLAVVAIAGLAVLAWRSHGDPRQVAALALLMLVLQVYVSGSVESWTVAGAFGQRRFVGVTALLTIGLAVILQRAMQDGWRYAVTVVLAGCVWWNLALTAAFGTGLMNRQRLELARNAYDAFVTIPTMAPDLAVRYLTQRESFYRQPAREHP